MSIISEIEVWAGKPLPTEIRSKLEWQTIDTAPRDKPVLVATTDGHVGEARYFADPGGWYWAEGGPHEYVECPVGLPTHWQPLPQPPEETE